MAFAAVIAPQVKSDDFFSAIEPEAVKETTSARPLTQDKISATSGVSMVNNKTMEGHPHGKPEIIIHFTENKPIVVDQEALAPLLKLNEAIGDYKIAVYSIVGAFRQGKSFLMDYCLRYLYAHYKSINFMENTCADTKGWMGGPDEPLKGFSWRSGKTGTTSGIVIWSDIFLHENDDGEKTAIVIMDTQGLFDTNAKMKDSAKIFALNSLFSSHLIFNMKSQIDEQQLKYLQLVSDYAKLMKETGEKEHKDYGHPFQNLLFLIRDWANFDDHPYGLAGGTEYVDDTLKTEGALEENAETREYIRNSYQRIKGFLMPYPGKKVAGAKNFNGSWSQMDEQFKISLKELVEYLFASENIQRKIIMGNTLTGLEYYTYLSAYCKIFASEDFPDLPNIYDATIDKHMAVHKNKAIDVYKEAMLEFEGDFTRFAHDADYEAKVLAVHQQHKTEAINFFKAEKKMGTPQIEEKYVNELDGDLELIYKKWCTRIIEVLAKFREAEVAAGAEVKRIKDAAEQDKKNLTNAFTERLQGLNETLFETRAEYEQQKIEWDRKQEEFNDHNAQLQKQINETVAGFSQTLEENRKKHEVALKNLEEERERERKERDGRDAENERKFNETIEKLKRENLENSEAYNRTIVEHRQQLAEEKRLREEQEVLRKKERDELVQSQKDMEASLMKQQADQKAKYESQMTDLNQRFEAEKQERIKQEQLRKDHDAKVQAEMRTMMETHKAQLEAAMKDKEKGMERIKAELEEKFGMERAETERQIDALQESLLTRSGSISIIPNVLVISLFSALVTAKFLLQLRMK